MQSRLYAIFRRVKTFVKKEEFMDYINNDFNEPNLHFIMSSSYAQELCHLIASKSETFKIYELNTSLTQSIRKSSNTWITFSNMEELLKTLDKDIPRQHIGTDRSEDILNPKNHADMYETFLPPLSILDSLSIPQSLYFFDKDSSTCLLFQLLTRILVEAKYGDQELEIMCAFCRGNYKENTSQIMHINTFQDEYDANKAIQFYTEYSFLFMLLTKVFQCEDTDGIYKFRRYIGDLHKSLAQRHRNPKDEIILYRGKKIPLIILQQLKDLKQRCSEKDAFISINGFLSTTKDPEVAGRFAGVGEVRDGYESTIFRLKINKEMTTTTVYTDITVVSSKIYENETLFSMSSVWKLLKIENDNGVWLIELELSNKFEDHLEQFQKKFLVDHPALREPTNAYYIFLLAKILYELGRYSQSGELYNDLLYEMHLSDDFKCLIHLNLATMQDEQGHFHEARKHLGEALKLRPSNQKNIMISSRATILNQIGLICQKQCKYPEAHKQFHAALNESNSSHIKATIHHNLGVLGMLRGQINEETHEHLREAVRLIENPVYAHQFRKDLEKMEELLVKNTNNEKTKVDKNSLFS